MFPIEKKAKVFLESFAVVLQIFIFIFPVVKRKTNHDPQKNFKKKEK